MPTIIDGAPPALAYQPQHLWNDGEFEMWASISQPTISKRVTRERLVMFKSVHPDAKLRVLEIVSSTVVRDAADFLPVEIPTRPNTPETHVEDRQAEREIAEELAQPDERRADIAERLLKTAPEIESEIATLREEIIQLRQTSAVRQT